jgi:DNA-binding transcriptional LysR family regulator
VVADLSPSLADLDLRLVRYFTVVAEQQHFGRAAAALHLAQPSLSRQIQRLEDQLGVRLLDRTPQGSRLTEAGQVFLPQARALLRAAREAAVTARAAAEPDTITIGYTGNLIVTPAVRDLRHRHPDADVQTRYLDWGGVHTALLDRRVDAAIARLPFPTDQLRVMVLYDEPRVVVLPTFHRLAGKESVSLADIAGEPHVRYTDAALDAFWRVDPRPDGRPAPDGPRVESLEDKLEVIASGQAIAMAPASEQDGTLRHDLTTVPIEGIEPCRVVLATRLTERSPLVSAFRESARRLLVGSTQPSPH